MSNFTQDNSKKASMIVILPFLIITVFFAIAFFVYPDQIKSETENRMLSQMPVLDNDSIINFPRDFEKYYNDQFPYRESFLEMLSRIELALNKTKIRNLYIADGFLLPQEYLYSDSQITDSAGKTNALMNLVRASGKTGVYISLPYKTAVYSYMLPSYLQNNYGVQNYENFVKKLDPAIKSCDAFRCYEGHPRSDLEKYFFKTDLHWNYRGAEVAFKYIMAWLDDNGLVNGLDPDKISYSSALIENSQYLGDLNRRYSFLFPTNEEIPVFNEVDTDVKYYLSYYDDQYTLDRKAIASASPEKGAEMYNSVYSNNLGYFRMVNDNSLLDAKVLILKDSMQNTMNDLFAQVFRSTEVVDVRYLDDVWLEELIRNSEAELVLLMYHQNNVTGDMFNFDISTQ